MVAPITQIGVDQSHIYFCETGSAKIIDALPMIPMYLLVTGLALEMLAFVRLSGQPFQQFGDDIFLSFAISQNEVGIYPMVRISDKFQMGVDDAVWERFFQAFDNIKF